MEGHDLPADWQARYFPGQSVDPEADPDGDGVTNWQEFLDGTDPTDFYNAQRPQLFLVGGGNQRAVAGSLLPQPVSIQVNYWGDQNAPVTFTARGGALLAPDPSGSYQPTTTVNVRATGQINVDGTQTYVGQVSVYLPDTVRGVCTITATASTAGQSVSVSTVATAADPNVAPPTDLNLVSNTSTAAVLSFTPSDMTLPVSFEVSQDGGITWALWATSDAGTSTFALTEFPIEQPLLVRAYTGSDAANGQTGQTSQTNTNDASPPDGTSPPTDPVGFTAYTQAHLVCRTHSGSSSNWSFKGYQTDARYQKIHSVFTDESTPSLSDNVTAESVWQALNDAVTVTVISGDPDSDAGAPVSAGETMDSDTQAHGETVKDYYAYPTLSEYKEYQYTYTLSELYTLAAFQADAEGAWRGWPNPFVAADIGLYHEAYDNRASLDLETVPQDTHLEASGYFDGFDTDYTIQKAQYAFAVNKDPNGHLTSDTVFLPKDGSPIIHAVGEWDTKGTTLSPVALLDPVGLNNKAQGAYRLLTAALFAYGHTDDHGSGTDPATDPDYDPGYDPGYVPSTKTDGTGQAHFVVPQARAGLSPSPRRSPGARSRA